MSVLDHLPVKGHLFCDKLDWALTVVQALASLINLGDLIEVDCILFEERGHLVLRLESVIVGSQVLVERILFVHNVLSVATQWSALGSHACLNLFFQFEFRRDALPQARFKVFVCVLRVTELGFGF